ncbi:helix-turn-helix transcriptional regulator [Brevundimonas sp.]|uniref:helix-turn-helix transcriptional regulator n=1 Tax=Brevundimonas sp. TaxID=1871086 RepID=UPI003D0AE1A6
MAELAIANNLRRLRFDHGEMTQDALAKAAGVTRQTIISLEAGRYAPSLELAMRLALVFGCPVDDVFHWKTPPSEHAAHPPARDTQ